MRSCDMQTHVAVCCRPDVNQPYLEHCPQVAQVWGSCEGIIKGMEGAWLSRRKHRHSRWRCWRLHTHAASGIAA